MHRGANSNDQLWHRANKHDNLYSATRVIHWRPAEQTRSGNAKYSAALCPPPPPHAPLPPRLAERSGPMLWGPAPVRCAKLEGEAGTARRQPTTPAWPMDAAPRRAPSGETRKDSLHCQQALTSDGDAAAALRSWLSVATPGALRPDARSACCQERTCASLHKSFSPLAWPGPH
ncbi:unnamed protein product, partial [Prorocentrum cordatum]